MIEKMQRIVYNIRCKGGANQWQKDICRKFVKGFYLRRKEVFFKLLILRILQTQIQCAPLYIGLFKMEYCAGFLMVFMKNQNIANFWMNMWRQTRKQWRTHWHEVITGRLLHVGIQH